MSRQRENMFDGVPSQSNLNITAQEFIPRSRNHHHHGPRNQFHQNENIVDRPSGSSNALEFRPIRNQERKQWRPNGGNRNFNGREDFGSLPRDNQRYYENARSMSWRDRNGGQQGQSQNGMSDRGYRPRQGKQSLDNGARNKHRDEFGNYDTEKDMGSKHYSHDYRPRNFNNSTGRNSFVKKLEGKNQMEVLVGLLTKGQLECLVCCEHVKQSESTWSCVVCHHVLHLRCVIKWARASGADEGWRCPACQHVSMSLPRDYYCFCGKMQDPAWNRSDCPHTCGSTCGLPRPDPCPHKCTLPCHPGPCPACRLYQSRSCGCGRASRTVQCAENETVVCGAPCSKTLNCGVHKCMELCHVDECAICDQIIKQVCFCGGSSQDVVCSKSSVGVTSFCCGKGCGKKLECGNHDCQLICHEGACPPCSLLPDTVTVCPCTKIILSDLPAPPRTSCLEPVPTCGNFCEKILHCGEPGNRHKCTSLCHEGACPPCPGETMARCRCGHLNKPLPCEELATTDDVRCEKKCNKKRSCGKHKCREACCIDVDHICMLPCTRTLSCGIHRCEEPCHTGYCRPCPQVSFEELFCECGIEVLLPPVPCGTRRPKCTQPCSRRHACAHTPTHSCHSDSECPPCTVLVSRLCHGGHELRKAIPCHQTEFSCGLPCGKPMPCGRHTCILPCHAGQCLRPDQVCVQPCVLSRSTCGHACTAPCHEPPCPDIPCKEVVKVTCECGHRFSTRSCVDNSRDYQRLATAQLASKMADLAAGQSIDLNDVAVNSKKMSFKTLECTEECKVIERNRRLAIGLQIRNPDLTAKLTPNYSEFLRAWAKKNSHFCQMVHDKLSELVQLAKQSKQKSRSYSFEPMNREKRQFIHEYCEHFGCEAVAYDPEPQRNVVATAFRDKSWLPGVSLLELIQRESGTRKIPLPNNTRMMPAQRSMEVLTGRSFSSATSAWGSATKHDSNGAS